MSISIRRVLFATDFSEPARHARQYAVMIAEQFSSQLIALHVVSEEAFLYIPDVAAGWLATEVDRARKQLATDFDTARTTIEVRTGNAVHEITKYVCEQDVDLLVIGTHGRTGLAHLLMGSTAEKIVRLASCPVLTVHPSGHPFVLDSSVTLRNQGA